jgi:hypothetical protein
LHHQRLDEVRGGWLGRREPSVWYVNVVWQQAGTGSGDPLPEPALEL